MQQLNIQNQKLVRGGGLFTDFLKLLKDGLAWIKSLTRR